MTASIADATIASSRAVWATAAAVARHRVLAVDAKIAPAPRGRAQVLLLRGPAVEIDKDFGWGERWVHLSHVRVVGFGPCGRAVGLDGVEGRMESREWRALVRGHEPGDATGFW
jgi:hypothetical protein